MTFQSTIVQKKLEEAGFETGLAHGLTAVLEQDVIATADNKFVTSDYLDNKLGILRSELKTDMAELRGDLRDLRSELKGDIAELRSEVRSECGKLRGELHAEIGGLHAEIGGLRGELHSETSKLGGSLRAEISAFKTEMLRWMIGLIVGATLTILVTLPRVIG